MVPLTLSTNNSTAGLLSIDPAYQQQMNIVEMHISSFLSQ